MRSHTVPRKLLDQFGYDDPVTKSRRLYRYEKDLTICRDASPKTATRWDRHFADPTNADKEEELESRLKREFEDPVNQFLESISDRSFAWTDERVRLLAGYMRMLFTRSRARKAASKIHAEIRVDSVRKLIRDDRAVDMLSNRLLASLIEGGHGLPPRPWSPRREVRQGLLRLLDRHVRPDEFKRDYVQTLETMMTFPDETMLSGRWTILYSEPDQVFVVGDAPVVTWERKSPSLLYFGLGFGSPNVEAFLPMSPTACIHVLPKVARTREVRRPSVAEVNIAQARFATRHCFSNQYSEELNVLLQPHFGKMRLGIDGFNINHLDASRLLLQILLNDGLPLSDSPGGRRNRKSHHLT